MTPTCTAMPGRTTVYSNRTDRRREFTTAILQHHTRDLLVRNPRRILVKPCMDTAAAYPATTHPDVLDATLHFLKRFHTDVVVADAPEFSLAAPARKIIDHPLHHTCAAHGLRAHDLNASKSQRIKTSSGFPLHVSALPLECDYVISLPVLKVHRHCTISGALRNQYGLFPLRERALMSSRVLKDMHRGIAEMNTVVRPNLTIMDAVATYARPSEPGNELVPARTGFMLAGTDPVALDCHGLTLLKEADPALFATATDNVAHLRWAIELGVGSADYQVRPLLAENME